LLDGRLLVNAAACWGVQEALGSALIKSIRQFNFFVWFIEKSIDIHQESQGSGVKILIKKAVAELECAQGFIVTLRLRPTAKQRW